VLTLGSESLLARVVGENKRYDEAEELYQKVLEDKRRVLGPLNAYTLSTQYNLAATTYWDQGRFAEADRLRRETYGLARKASNALIAGLSSYAIACIAARRGRKPEALAWLRKSLDSGIVVDPAMDKDADLASLRGDPEFERLSAAARRDAAKPPPQSR
jgi:tetratricopeptide (TPR) repeat protein